MDTIELIAKTCHEVNRVYCQSLGDQSQPIWELAPEWQKQSAKDGVLFHMNNPEAGPEGSHENWMKTKFEDGWIYGETKDPEKKTHPCLVPYRELPAEQQFKDAFFIAVVRSFEGLTSMLPTLDSKGAEMVHLGRSDDNSEHAKFKTGAAMLINKLEEKREGAPPQVQRTISLAETHLEIATMFACRSIRPSFSEE